jgi:hypothetical protein
MKSSTYNIPILPYLKKYVVKKFFDGHSPPYKMEEDTLLGKQFMSVIIDARKIDFIDRHLEMSDRLSVKLSNVMAERSVTLAKLVPINFFLDKIFKEELITWILSADYHGIRPFPAIRNFLAYYSIEEREYSLDAAYRHWLRWKNKDYHTLQVNGKKNPRPVS